MNNTFRRLEKFNGINKILFPHNYNQRIYNFSGKIKLRHSNFSFSTESLNEQKIFDIVVVGGGVVGMATSLYLKKCFPNFNILVLEKEPRLAGHQSGNNGGVIHSGIYYKPRSLRSKLCVEGMYRLYKYCEANDVPYKRNGKLIVATKENEIKLLDNLYKNAKENEVPDIRLINSNEIRKIEPYCKGLKAIHSPNTGIINFANLTQHFGKKFQELGGKILLNCQVTGISEVNEGSGTTLSDSSSYPIRVSTSQYEIHTQFVVTCGGLYSDKLAGMTGEKAEPQIIPIRGEYFLLNDNKKHLVNGSIYQVPNPDLPFHGMHFTSQLDGKIWVGPKSILAPHKEGYKWNDYNLKELWEICSYPGFQLFLMKYCGPCLYEFMKSVNSTVTFNKLRQYIPSLEPDDIIPGGSVGVQAHGMNANGELVEEFQFSEQKRILHCRNLPSPAATASLAIAAHLTDKVQKQLRI